MRKRDLPKTLLSLGLTLWLGIVWRSAAFAEDQKIGGRTFRLPDGFAIELVAEPPLVERPIVADFDEQGRLYVADSSGTNDPVQKQLADRPHRIVRLEDADGDGIFDKSIVFADRMMFPEGTLWYDGSLYVAAPPSIWKLTDADGDGKAERREEWFQGKTLTGCANDLHGPYLGRDGWIYWCKGAFAEQTYDRPGKPPFKTRAAHIFRRRPEGGPIEPVMTGGMDNPVDVVFTPGGERIFSATFLQHPGGGRRDGLAHAIYGGLYGKVHNVLDGHPRTSADVMPILTHLGPAAVCGLEEYESVAFGNEYRGNLFATLFNLRKVTRHELVADGATFKTVDRDFLVCLDDRDFHPTDVREDADGSLLVLDTGGWYKLCCPTSQLKKPDVRGAIYRLKRANAPKVDDPRGLKIAWSKAGCDDLTLLLDDPRPAVRRRAVQTLAKREEDALPALEKTIRSARSAEARRDAVWASTRIEAESARVLCREALKDRDESVRQSAAHSAAVRRDRKAVANLVELLRSASLPNRRAAAEALGRIGDSSAVPAILQAARGRNDRSLRHSLTYALIEIADSDATAEGLTDRDPSVRQTAWSALDQMEGGRLSAKDVAPWLASANADLKETAVWIASRRDSWGDEIARVFREGIFQDAFRNNRFADLETLTPKFANLPPIQEMIAERSRDPKISRDAKASLLRIMARSGLKKAPASWAASLAAALSSDDGDDVRSAVSAAKALRFEKSESADLIAALLKVARSDRVPASVRLEALAAVPEGLGEIDADLFSLLVEPFQNDRTVSARLLAADVLTRSKLGRDRLLTLADLLATVGSLEVDRLLPVFEKTSDDEVGLRLISALERSPASSGLRAESLKPRLTSFGPKVQEKARELYAKLDAQTAQARSRLEELLSTLRDGDIRRGQAVFNSTKAACASCHSIGYVGGKVGPDLTNIGQIRRETDLLESIVFPSASFVRSYEPVTVSTKTGKIHNGVLRKDSADEVILTTGPDQDVAIARDAIDEMRPGTVSVMPAGLDRQISRQELADLLAFLKATRWGN